MENWYRHSFATPVVGLVDAHNARSDSHGLTGPADCIFGIDEICDLDYKLGVKELLEIGLEPAFDGGSPWDGLDFPNPFAPLDAAVPCRFEGQWLLVYRLMRRDGSAVLIAGGPPNSSPSVSEEWASLGWQIPKDLAHMYRFHDGLGPIDGPGALWWRDSILPAARLAPLTQHVRFGEDAILYRPGDLLLLSPDGEGGGWCFHRQGDDDPTPTLVHWDGTSHRLAGELSFRSLLRRLTAGWLTAG